MAFLLFLLVNATLFLRPAEIFPDLRGMPIYECLMAGCLIGYRHGIMNQLRPSRLVTQPVTMCALLMLAAIGLSHLTHVYFYGFRTAIDQYIRTFAYFLIALAALTTTERLNTFLRWVAISASLMVLLCVIDYAEIVDFEFVTHIDDREGSVTETNEQVMVQRMRGTGIFEDPNDICLVINAAGVLCLYFFTAPGWNSLRLLWLAPMFWLGLGLLFTHSRGGLLSCGAAVITLLSFRYDMRIGIAAAIGGIAILPVIGGRQGSIDLEDGTGQDRIQLWAEGFEALKSADLFFGIGMNEYGDMAGLVAHNSFVHAYTELGIFGGTLFFGMFLFSALSVYRASRVLDRLHDRSLIRLQPFLAAMLLGWSIGLMSLSRCYVVPTYLLLATVTAYSNLVAGDLTPPRPLVRWDRHHIGRLVCCSAVWFMGLFLFTKLMARWS